MALETGTYIDDLVSTNPAATDLVGQGDDHIRLVKATIKATFPDLTGRAWRVQAKGSGYTLVADDNMSVIRATAAITLDLTAAATVGNGFIFAVVAEAVTTIDPAGAETINGETTLTVPAGYMAIVWCNGTNFAAMVAGDQAAPVVQTGFRNKIINGAFRKWQRGTTFSAATSGRYTADRWFANADVNHTIALSRQAFTIGQTDVPGEPAFFYRAVVVTGAANAGNAALTAQLVESVRTLAGQTAVLTFWAKASASLNNAVEFSQNFGTGGAPSADVTAIGVTTVALTTLWQKFTIPVTVPSISGKTLGTAGNDRLGVNFWHSAGSSFNARTDTLGEQAGTFDIAQVQLEPGLVDTPFEHIDPAIEDTQCARYYQHSFPEGVTPAQSAGQGGALLYRVRAAGSVSQTENAWFSVPMRTTTPTITYFNPSAANANWRNLSDAADSGAANTDSSGGRYITVLNPQVAADSVGDAVAVHWTADAEF